MCNFFVVIMIYHITYNHFGDRGGGGVTRFWQTYSLRVGGGCEVWMGEGSWVGSGVLGE